MTRVAALDCGTNSLRLLVADVEPARGELADVVRQMEIVRLGQGVDRTGRLGPEALGRTFEALRRYAEDHRGHWRGRGAHGGDERDPRRGQRRRVHQWRAQHSLASSLRSSAGEEEAALSFVGATAELAATGPAGPVPRGRHRRWLHRVRARWRPGLVGQGGRRPGSREGRGGWAVRALTRRWSADRRIGVRGRRMRTDDRTSPAQRSARPRRDRGRNVRHRRGP